MAGGGGGRTGRKDGGSRLSGQPWPPAQSRGLEAAQITGPLALPLTFACLSMLSAAYLQASLIYLSSCMGRQAEGRRDRQGGGVSSQAWPPCTAGGSAGQEVARQQRLLAREEGSIKPDGLPVDARQRLLGVLAEAHLAACRAAAGGRCCLRRRLPVTDVQARKCERWSPGLSLQGQRPARHRAAVRIAGKHVR